MYILAFDTCFDAVSVAVAHAQAGGARVLAAAAERRRSGHAERLLPMIAAAMRQAGVGFQDLGRIAVTLGPGTFSGVRTGIATARALALASGCPAVGVGTLSAIAFAARAELGTAQAAPRIAVALDARLGMLYFQLFSPTAAALSQPALLPPQDCWRLLAGQPAIIIGSGAASILALGEADAAGILAATAIAAEPHASSVAMLGLAVPPGSLLQPLYLRAPDAKPQAGALPRAAS
jgi:tRNA threonylcarbamoyladenosine biosynthesis protein TsaB